MWKISLLISLPLTGLAQATTDAPAWGGGLGVGNGIEAHIGRQQRHQVWLGRVRYRWWRPSSGPGASFLDDINTQSWQTEVAALGGYSLPLGRALLYGAVGLSYLNGRQLGEYRYAVQQSGLLGSSTYYFSYRDYQALGVPVEVGLLSPANRRSARVGLAFQGNFNPEKPLYCGMLTFWLGNFGGVAK